MTRLADALDRGADKIMKAIRGRWNTLSFGEKLIKVVYKLIVIAVIVTVIAVFGALIAGIALGTFLMYILIGGAGEVIDGEIDRHNRWRKY